MNKQKQCAKCGAEIKSSDKFCTDCGLVVSQISEEIKSNIHKVIKKSFFARTEVIIVEVIVIIVGLIIFGSILYFSSFQNPSPLPKPLEDNITTANPAYLASPNSFIVDSKKQISNDPEDNKSVWVEKIVDNNTIIVSYIILKGNENFLTFRTIEIAGISGQIGGCFEELGISFLKSLIEHKYVYLASPKDWNAQNSNEPGLLKYVSILSEDVDQSIIDTSEYEADYRIRIEAVLVYGGYAVVDTSRGDNSYLWELKRDGQEVAQVAKRGFWGACKPINN